MKIATITHMVSGRERMLDMRADAVKQIRTYGRTSYVEKRMFGAAVYARLSEPIEYTMYGGEERLASYVSISVAYNNGMEIGMWDNDNRDSGMFLSEDLEEHRDWENPIAAWLNELGYVVKLDEWNEMYRSWGDVARWPRYGIEASLNYVQYNVNVALKDVLANDMLVKAIKGGPGKGIVLGDANRGLLITMPSKNHEREIDRIKFVLTMYFDFCEIYEGE